MEDDSALNPGLKIKNIPLSDVNRLVLRSYSHAASAVQVIYCQNVNAKG